ncbi:DUF2269 domain-containing protein [Nocardia uniformis]|uniref:DUF2269 domain-containing protein n=2 Tax=Nocardia uniformis TaxID=53432 RepID=A0A849C574_9NOCA|nr:DUF2269 domain-containing protein [Nocardia uniformis]
MLMSKSTRKLALTAHVMFSVGWIGAILAFLALAISGMTSQDLQTVRADYLAMQVLAWWVIVPLSFASLLSGIVQSLGTTWGLVRHYWVLFKLVLNLTASVVLLLYTQIDLKPFIEIASRPAWTDADLAMLRSPTNVGHCLAALFLLIAATVLAVYKPAGMTRYGQRKRREKHREPLLDSV